MKNVSDFFNLKYVAKKYWPFPTYGNLPVCVK